MMRKLIVIGIVAVMVMGLAAVANAAAPDSQWQVYLQAGNSTALAASGGPGIFGTMSSGYGDAFDSGKDATTPPPFSPDTMIWVYSSLAANCTTDLRAPVTTSKTWNISIFAGDGVTSSNDIVIKGWQPSGNFLTNTKLDNPSGFTTLALYRVGNPTPVWNINASAGTSSTSANAPFTLTLPKVDSAHAYQFQLVAATVPEPGSMLAMLSGLVGLVGYGIRRRK